MTSTIVPVAALATATKDTGAADMVAADMTMVIMDAPRAPTQVRAQAVV